MLSVSKRPQFIEKILTDAYGRQFKVVFAVTIIDGEFRGRIVSATEIKSLAGEIEPALCLSGYYSNSETQEDIVSPYAPVVTPFFSLEFLINSQPTRAPSRA